MPTITDVTLFDRMGTAAQRHMTVVIAKSRIIPERTAQAVPGRADPGRRNTLPLTTANEPRAADAMISAHRIRTRDYGVSLLAGGLCPAHHALTVILPMLARSNGICGAFHDEFVDSVAHECPSHAGPVPLMCDWPTTTCVEGTRILRSPMPISTRRTNAGR
jgi:hypothetical protein